MVVIVDPVSVQHVDEDTDDIFQARANIKAYGDAINNIRTYLIELFGWDGTKATAISTLFANQQVLFPNGTNMYFINPTVPPGWVKWWNFISGSYLRAVSDDSGGGYAGNNDVWLQTQPTSLVQGMLPNITMTGTTNTVGEHVHLYRPTRIFLSQFTAGSASVAEAEPQQRKIWLDYQDTWSGGGGSHWHTISVPTGGLNWGHDHLVSMHNYRPLGLTGVIGQKV